MEKLKSRKLWLAVAGLVSVVAAEFLGVDIQPEALASGAAILVTYLGGQSFVDAKQAKAEAELYRDEAIQSLTIMVGQLQQRLAQTYNEAEGAPAATTENDTGQYV